VLVPGGSQKKGTIGLDNLQKKPKRRGHGQKRSLRGQILLGPHPKGGALGTPKKKRRTGQEKKRKMKNTAYQGAPNSSVGGWKKSFRPKPMLDTC